MSKKAAIRTAWRSELQLKYGLVPISGTTNNKTFAKCGFCVAFVRESGPHDAPPNNEIQEESDSNREPGRGVVEDDSDLTEMDDSEQQETEEEEQGTLFSVSLIFNV